MSVRLACIVEGHGEVSAVPVLLRRLAALVDPGLAVHIPQPIRVPRDKLVKQGELERAVELAARKIGGQGAIVVLVDSHGDCPAHLGPQLLQRALNTRGNLPFAVIVAKQEYEAWFLAAAESLRGLRGLDADLSPPSDPEAITGAKEWLSERMEGNRKYVETLDQPALSQTFDIDQARRSSASFDKCYRDILRLLQPVQQAGPSGAPPA